MRTLLRTALSAAAATAALPALAQETPPNTDTGGDFALVGLGVGVLPDYEGSDDYSLSPVPGAIGRVSGFNFVFAGNRLSVDLIPDAIGPGWDFQAGPIGVVNFNRSSTDGIDDPQIRALGERDTAIELGGYIGIGRVGVITSEFDRLSASVSYRTGVSGAHSAGIFTPTVNYTTPLSTRSIASLFVSGERVERGYADAYFSVDAAGSAASGLPVYNARGGWKNWTVGALGAHSITGDLTGGLQAFGGVVYRRLLNDFADSPVTRSKSQWVGTVGVAYSF